MEPEEKKCPNEMQAYVMHLRYRLAQYQFHRIAPPVKLLIELKMAMRLAELDSKDAHSIDVKI